MNCPACPDPQATLGQWNAYVASGRGRTQRDERYKAFPEALQPAVASHMRTLEALERRT